MGINPKHNPTAVSRISLLGWFLFASLGIPGILVAKNSAKGSRELTTHVLDTAKGIPAAGMKIELYRINETGARNKLVTASTGPNGRPEGPLLVGSALSPGLYEIWFYVGDYFGIPTESKAPRSFLDVVPVRFGVDENSLHYHVPLVVSPGSYTVYRGS